jgi:alanine racemase
VAIGYGDGYPGSASDGTAMLVSGKPAPLVGKVSMDMITVDLTDRPDTNVDDSVILWGPELPVGRVAETSGSTGYELLTGVSHRVPREYGTGH